MKVVANSLPKSGTHLLTRVMELMGLAEGRLHLSGSMVVASSRNPIRRYWVKRRILTAMRRDGISVALDQPEVLIRSEWLEKQLAGIRDNTYIEGHLPFSTRISELLATKGFKILTIVRDPRDVLVSFCNHIVRDPDYEPFHCYFKQLPSEEARLLAALGPIRLGAHFYGGLATRINGILGWHTQSSGFTAKFEDLVGTKGNGSAELQLRALKGIIEHLGIEKNSSELDKIRAEVFFPGARTFFKGRIGAWKNSFTPAVECMFMEKCGQLMVDLGYSTNKELELNEIKTKYQL